MAPQTEQKIYVGIGLDFETGGLDCRECACTQIALQAVRFDTWQVFDRYQAYIAPYGKQDAGLPRRKVLRTRHEQAKGQEYVPMKYEQAALDYSAMEHRTEIQSLKDRVVILTAVIRYSDYNGCNTLQTYKNSLLFIQS